jgi:hypothetical protein
LFLGQELCCGWGGSGWPPGILQAHLRSANQPPGATYAKVPGNPRAPVTETFRGAVAILLRSFLWGSGQAVVEWIDEIVWGWKNPEFPWSMVLSTAATVASF